MRMRGSTAYYFDFILPLVGIGIMVYYDLCDTACAFLKGNLFGIDLKYIGIIFMTFLLLLSLPLPSRFLAITDPVRTMMLSGALGGEVWLVRFQIINAVFCPYCLVFALLLVILFALHAKQMNYYLAALSFLAGLILFAFFFRGTVLPLYSLYHNPPFS
ncbi:MAG: hypothetical protein N2572_06015 [Syntrophales bacterium]|nr:hypothetical protein [Syntrophales bacterium]